MVMEDRDVQLKNPEPTILVTLFGMFMEVKK
jgi:hypothetical protein